MTHTLTTARPVTTGPGDDFLERLMLDVYGWDGLVPMPRGMDTGPLFPYLRTMPDGRRGMLAFDVATRGLVRDFRDGIL